MKVAWLLIIVGILLLLEGTSRIIYGFVVGDYLYCLGGVITGWLPGIWLFAKGVRRRKKLNGTTTNP